MSHNRVGYSRISPSKAKKMLERHPEVVLLDVRTPAEYYYGHIPGSINIPVQRLQEEIVTQGISPDRPIIVYCQSGQRSSYAASFLAARGYRNVYTFGGIENWPYDIVRYAY
jgi:phage shock protein E